ncbi:hypothetical protein GCM10009785_26700 [Brooklawnia cerclae]|uniref:Uncharacterized protein n=1 Tax=Brooklawnia cerclae TaxID=349934 RepID=A0ABX0SKR3_9ACTN|nr:hypothetical protein [Brooklawnia cerclae]NIH57321.1 hypothetical protein [Brooklawnia cerclae]
MTTAKPSYADLLAKRVSTGARQIIREKVSLDPALFADLEDARQAMYAEQLKVKDGKPTKANGGPLNAAKDRVEAIEQQIRDSTIVVTLRALSADQLIAVQAGVVDETPVVDVWRARLAEAFAEAKTPSGDAIPEIGKGEWAQLLATVATGELQKWHNDLEKAGNAPSFPTFAK